MTRPKSRRAVAVIVVALVAALAAGTADARPGRGGSFGSRGSRTYSAPPPTATAPRPSGPLERSTTQAAPGMQRPGAATAAGARRSGFSSGLMGGLLGAGLIGLLFGSGLFGGFSGLASLLGLVLQVALIAGLVMVVLRFVRRRSDPVMAGAGSPLARTALRPDAVSRPVGGGSASTRIEPITVEPADYAAFEKALEGIQSAFSREDVGALRGLATPEMAAHFEGELAENARRGVVNRLSGLRLLQGDLAEAWRERDGDYATVAMRYAIADATLDRATGRVVAGDPTRSEEVTEIWTFRRVHGDDWRLSAIQQG